MSVEDSLYDTVRGVLEELVIDLHCGMSCIFQLVGISHIIDRLICDVRMWRHGRGNTICGRKVSVIRILGSALPLKPVARPSLNGEDRLTSVCLQSSIPFSGSQSTVLPVEATIKIAQLECELKRLRYQIALMIQQNTTKPPSISVHANTEGIFEPLSTISPLTKPAPSVIPPPPPLPPCTNIPSAESLSLKILQRKFNNKQSELVNKDKSENTSICMMDVLRGISSVKLRKIDRTPGGRPVRVPRTPDPYDHASIMAAALKRRFAKIHVESPEKDGDISDFGSPDTPVLKCRRISPRSAVGHGYSNSPKDLKPVLEHVTVNLSPVIKGPTSLFGEDLDSSCLFKPEEEQEFELVTCESSY